mmetsp:Transcript_37908/g.67958  ORF Transcript_37908/g.67958 Transcript_37908/m.67958 type:complete len:331 (-) Transcript_37908:951-1943(-)
MLKSRWWREVRAQRPAALLLLLLLLVLAPVSAVPSSESLQTAPLPGYDDTDCEDKVAGCHRWAEAGECHQNPYYMIESCPQSCLPHCKSKNRWLGPYPGYASELGTRSFAVAGLGVGTADGHLRRDPSMGDYYTPGQKLRGDPWLYISSLGVGTQLGKEDAATDRLILSAILKSIASGWNVIDTAVSYRQGRSEAMVGAALGSLIKVGSISREMLFIGTKAGFFSDAPDFKEQARAAGEVPEGVVLNGHCIHPACLKASLTTSLTRMGLETVDVLYLHFPAEQQLQALGRQAFMQRLAESFAFLEEARALGRIRAYGLATWDCFRTPPTR